MYSNCENTVDLEAQTQEQLLPVCGTLQSGRSPSSKTVHLPATGNFKGHTHGWSAFTMEMLSFSTVSVRSHITALVAMVTDYTSSSSGLSSCVHRQGRPWVAVGSCYPDTERRRGGILHFLPLHLLSIQSCSSL